MISSDQSEASVVVFIFEVTRAVILTILFMLHMLNWTFFLSQGILELLSDLRVVILKVLMQKV